MEIKKHILITGGTGFLGREIRAFLANISCKVTVLTRRGATAYVDVYPNEEVLEISWPQEISSIDMTVYDYVIYLSFAPVSQSQKLSDVLEINFDPLARLVHTIKQQNKKIKFIFISSQSALQSVDSHYGELKRVCEEFLINSELPGVIIRPGLIFGSGNKGLFNSIKGLVASCPVVPLIGASHQVIQPLYIKDFVSVLCAVSGIQGSLQGSIVGNDKMKIVELADAPISFHEFIKKIAYVMNRRRIFIPVPNVCIYAMLWILEHVFLYKKITTSSLLGFLNLSLLDHEKIWEEHKKRPTNLDDALRESVS